VSQRSPTDLSIEPAPTTAEDALLVDLTSEGRHRIRLLRAIGLAWTVAGVVFLVAQVAMWMQPGLPRPPLSDLLLDVLVIPVGPLVVWLLRRNRCSVAAWLIIAFALLGSSAQLFIEGQPTTDVAGRLGLLMTVAVAFVLLERRGAWLVFAASSLLLIAAHIFYWAGLLPPPILRDPLTLGAFSMVAWLIAAGILATVLYSTMSAMREQAQALRKRVRDLTLLHGIGNRVARTLDLEDVLETAVESLQSSFGYDSVVILTRPGEADLLTARAAAGKHADILPENHTQALTEGLIGWAASRGGSVIVNDVEADPRYVNHYPDWVSTQSELCVPIRAGDDVVGVLDVQSDRLDAFSEADRRTLETLAGQIGVAMENARLYQAERAARDQLRDLVSYIQSAQEDERTHIAREILDEFGQLMAALQMDLTWLRQRLNEDQTALADKTRKSSTIVDQSIQVVQRLSSELRPSVLDHFGLAAAVRWQADAFAERTGITPQLRLDVDADLVEPDLATALFRILQEAMSNVALHAEATQVFIRLRTDEQRVALIIQDNGRGIRPEEADGTHSLGLVGMRERARALDGDVNIDGIPGHGTTVTATIPRLGDQEGA